MRHSSNRPFRPYGQVDSKITQIHQGTGLGLPIAQSLATTAWRRSHRPKHAGRRHAHDPDLPENRVVQAVTTLPGAGGGKIRLRAGGDCSILSRRLLSEFFNSVTAAVYSLRASLGYRNMIEAQISFRPIGLQTIRPCAGLMKQEDAICDFLPIHLKNEWSKAE